MPKDIVTKVHGWLERIKRTEVGDAQKTSRRRRPPPNFDLQQDATTTTMLLFLPENEKRHPALPLSLYSLGSMIDLMRVGRRRAVDDDDDGSSLALFPFV